MAFVYPEATCKICGKKLGDNYDPNDVVGMPDMISIMTDFYSFSDGVMDILLNGVLQQGEDK